jgi:hypothetical protein
MNTSALNNAHDLPIEQIGWRYYNSIKKKAMEQEFSWSGLWLSLSIAFFIVILSAFSLSLLYNSLSNSTFERLIIENDNTVNQIIVEIDGIKMERIENLNLV